MEFASTKEFVTLIFEHMFLFFIDCHEISIFLKNLNCLHILKIFYVLLYLCLARCTVIPLSLQFIF